MTGHAAADDGYLFEQLEQRFRAHAERHAGIVWRAAAAADSPPPT